MSPGAFGTRSPWVVTRGTSTQDVKGVISASQFHPQHSLGARCPQSWVPDCGCRLNLACLCNAVCFEATCGCPVSVRSFRTRWRWYWLEFQFKGCINNNEWLVSVQRHVGWLFPWPQTNLAAHSGQEWPLFPFVEGPLYFRKILRNTLTVALTRVSV